MAEGNQGIGRSQRRKMIRNWKAGRKRNQTLKAWAREQHPADSPAPAWLEGKRAS